MNNLNELSKQIYNENQQRGFDVAKENVGQTLMLVVSELSEALEADRKNQKSNYYYLESGMQFQSDIYPEKERFVRAFNEHIKDTFEDEIADAFIRLFDLCGGLEIDIEKHIELKRKYNSLREFKHGKKY